jgi:BASS family bile acid:Na+ symporter
MLTQKTFDRYFWLFLILGVVFGFLVPKWAVLFEQYIIHIVMAIMCLLFLKIDIMRIVKHLTTPFFLLFVCFITLIVTPLLTFLIFRFFEPNLFQAIVLLSALPTGISSALFTDIMRGRAPLALTITIVTNLFAAFTIPFIFWLLFKQNLDIDYFSLFVDLLSVIFIPFLIAKTLKHVVLKKWHPFLQNYYNSAILILLFFMIMIIIAYQADYIIQNFTSLLFPLAMLFVVFIFFQMVGYFSVIWRTTGGKLAVSNANLIMNNVLGVVIAVSFFPPQVVTLIILSFIPRSILIICTHWYKRYLPRIQLLN